MSQDGFIFYIYSYLETMMGTSVSGQDAKVGTEFTLISDTTTKRDKIHEMMDFEILDMRQQRTIIDEAQEADEVSPLTVQLVAL